MAGENQEQNGAPKIPEGDRWLFVRLSKENEFQVLFSNHFDAQALHRMAGRTLDKGFDSMFQQGRPDISIPGLNLTTLERIRKGKV
jgi:hypothetical protein